MDQKRGNSEKGKVRTCAKRTGMHKNGERFFSFFLCFCFWREWGMERICLGRGVSWNCWWTGLQFNGCLLPNFLFFYFSSFVSSQSSTIVLRVGYESWLGWLEERGIMTGRTGKEKGRDKKKMEGNRGFGQNSICPNFVNFQG